MALNMVAFLFLFCIESLVDQPKYLKLDLSLRNIATPVFEPGCTDKIFEEKKQLDLSALANLFT